MPKSYRFVVTGRVQGVYYRQSACDRAMALGLHGWVRNRTDGAVEGVVAGPDQTAVEGFRSWLAQGPPAARVRAVDWTPSDETVGGNFEVRR